MSGFIEGRDRRQGDLLPEHLEDYVASDNPVRVVDVFVDELDLAAHAVARNAASATGPGEPAMVSTMRLWTASAWRSSTAAPRTLAAAASMASITSGRLPSLKLGTHSTRDVEADVWVSLALTIVVRELH